MFIRHRRRAHLLLFQQVKAKDMKKIVFITDTWKDRNTNGVVTWLINMQAQLERQDFEVTIIHPSLFNHVPLPTYPEIRMAISTTAKMKALIGEHRPDYIHIATEGPLGLAARTVCVKQKWQFTSYYHTRLPEYVSLRFKLLGRPAAQYMKWFHKTSSCVMVSTDTLKEELEGKGFIRVAVVPLGVDLAIFHHNIHAEAPAGISRPLFVFMGRIATEKNIEAFLACTLPGTKMIIGDGPAKAKLEKEYSDHTLFVGHKTGEELTNLLSASDVFVFPSRTDTFSLAIIEALACGLPVAAYDVQGPRNILTDGKDGYVGDNLEENALKCLEVPRENCTKSATRYSWEHSAFHFVSNLSSVY
jgi:glycosyltransferase involved in cell wall biosynthesis